jgi:dolichyl-phosphate beta-glucosyltransferase
MTEESDHSGRRARNSHRDSGSSSLSVVVPFFNEMHRLHETIGEIVGLAVHDVEVILVDDGSTDGTGEVLSDAARHLSRVEVIRLPRNRGKGAAVRAGVAGSSGDHVVFMDADLATDLGDLPLVRAALDHAHVAIGSRSVPATALTNTTRVRSAMGDIFNRSVRTVTGLEFRDTQCGFKAFRGPEARSLFAHTSVDGFAFDVEVLMLARASGMRIVEVPIRWTQVSGSKVRLAVDPLKMLCDLPHIRRHVPGAAELIAGELTRRPPEPVALPTPSRGARPSALPASSGHSTAPPLLG